MPAIASLEDLQKLNTQIRKLRQEHPEVCAKVIEIIKKNRKLGYRNFCKLFTGERTPEQLKGKGRQDEQGL